MSETIEDVVTKQIKDFLKHFTDGMTRKEKLEYYDWMISFEPEDEADVKNRELLRELRKECENEK